MLANFTSFTPADKLCLCEIDSANGLVSLIYVRNQNKNKTGLLT